MAFEDIVAKFLIVMVALSALFLMIVGIQEDNSAVNPLDNESQFNNSLSELASSIDSGTSQAQEKYGVFNSEEPQTGFGSIVLFGIVSVGKTFSNIVFDFFGSIIKLPLQVLGIPESIYNTMLTWLIILLIVGAWILYKLG